MGAMLYHIMRKGRSIAGKARSYNRLGRSAPWARCFYHVVRKSKSIAGKARSYVGSRVTRVIWPLVSSTAMWMSSRFSTPASRMALSKSARLINSRRNTSL